MAYDFSSADRPIKFSRNRTSPIELSIFSDSMAPQTYTTGFRFGDITHIRRWKSIYKTNLDEISQTPARIVLLMISENKRQLYWNSISGFDRHCGRDSASADQISSGINRIISGTVMTSSRRRHQSAIVDLF